MRKILIAAMSVLIVTQPLFADSAFEGKQGVISRSAYKLFGGQVESMTTDSKGDIYLGLLSPNGAYCSTDGGATWTSPGAGSDLGNIAKIAAKPDGSAVFVIGGIRLFRSTDGCATWSEISAIDANYAFEMVYAHNTLLAVSRNDVIDRSVDDGATLSHINIASDVTDIVTVAASPTANEFYTLATTTSGTTLYRSVDAGLTWTATGKTGSYKKLAVDPSNAQNIVLGDGAGSVEQSTDGGATWHALNPNPPPNGTHISFAGNKLFIDTSYSSDGGNTWHDVNAESTSTSEITRSFAGDPTNSNIIYASSSLGVAKSTDGGLNWVDKVDGIFGVSIQGIAQSNNKNTVYLATTQGLARTNNFLDDELIWSFPVDLGSGVTTGGLYAVHVDQSTPAIVYLGVAGGYILRSTDSGSTWTQVSGSQGPTNLTDIIQSEDGTLYASYGSNDESATGGVLKSSDGITWTNISNGSFNARVGTLTNVGNTILAGLGTDRTHDAANQKGVWKYDGTTWTQVSGSIATKAVWDLLSIGDVVLAATVPTQQGGPGLVGDSGTILRSIDGGETWTEANTSGLKEDNAFYRTLAVDPKKLDTVYAAQGNPAGIATIYQSGDKGQTWNLIYTGLTDEVPAAMLVDGLLSGFNTGLFGFDKGRAALTLKYDSKKKKVLCTLKSGRTALGNQYVNLVKKTLRRKNVAFALSKRAKTSSKGIASFSAKGIKKKTAVRCEWTDLKSKTRKF